MVFSSITFLFFFLPGVLLLYFLFARQRNLLLLAASLFFYSWGEGQYLLVMLLSIGINYLCGIGLGNSSGKNSSRLLLATAILFNLSLLGFFKYANFLVENLNMLLIAANLPRLELAAVHLPIGISFFTFQAISYLIDVYRKQAVVQNNLISLGLYISLFPQLIAGPIVRYNDISEALNSRKIARDDVSYGISRFLFGLSKKVLLANPLALAADTIFALPQNELTVSVAWLGALCFTLQIYFDFSGYSDMAIGLGRIFGFRFFENFNYPYIACSIQEFWRRWHISLSSWLRDYLYIPLGGNRKGSLRTYSNLLIVFFLCGLWHGASWTFVCWGLYHGFFLIAERTPLGKWVSSLWPGIRYPITMVIVIVGWVIFRSESLAQASYFLKIMFFLLPGSERELLTLFFDTKLAVELTAAILFSLPVLPWLIRLRQDIEKRLAGSSQRAYFAITTETIGLVILIYLTYLTTISLAAGVYNPFIYFRF